MGRVLQKPLMGDPRVPDRHLDGVVRTAVELGVDRAVEGVMHRAMEGVVFDAMGRAVYRAVDRAVDDAVTYAETVFRAMHEEELREPR